MLDLSDDEFDERCWLETPPEGRKWGAFRALNPGDLTWRGSAWWANPERGWLAVGVQLVRRKSLPSDLTWDDARGMMVPRFRGFARVVTMERRCLSCQGRCRYRVPFSTLVRGCRLADDGSRVTGAMLSGELARTRCKRCVAKRRKRRTAAGAAWLRKLASARQARWRAKKGKLVTTHKQEV